MVFKVVSAKEKRGRGEEEELGMPWVGSGASSIKS